MAQSICRTPGHLGAREPAPINSGHSQSGRGRPSDVRLEPVMWEALLEIARQRQTNVNQLVTEIDRQRVSSSLTAAICVYIVDFYRAAAIRPDRAAASLQPTLN